MNNELIKQIVSNHKELTKVRKSYFSGDIEITVNQDKEKLVVWAFNHKSQRFLNLLANKYSKLIDSLSDISLDMKHKEHYIYFTLDTINDNKVKVSNALYGYARVSTKSQEDNTSLQKQIKVLRDSGCTETYSEVCSGATMDRPIFKELESKLKNGDTLIITKLDRFSRSTENGINKIKELAEKGVKVNILNMGIVDLNNPIGKMMFTILSSFAEYEKDCIVERMKEGKEIAKQNNPNFREGRPVTHKESKKAHALELLRGGKTYKEVELLTGISKSTLIRYKNKVELLNLEGIEHLKAKIKLRQNLIKLQDISESSIIYKEYLEMIEEVKRLEKSK